MNYFITDKESKIVIYGYSVNGRTIANFLKKHSYNVVAFFDRNAKSHAASNVIKIISIKEGIDYFSHKLDEIIVIISIANVFEHKSIAMQLQKEGFEKIIFFPDFSFNQNADDVMRMKGVFKMVLAGEKISNEKLPFYKTIHNHLNRNFKQVDEKTVIALIPIELIHIGNRQILIENDLASSTICNELEKLPYYFDTPLSGFNYYLDLYDYFEGNNGNGSDSYFKWKQAMNKGKHLVVSDKHRLLDDRLSVYKNMTDALSINDNFFTANPVELIFNKNGYFYIIDGSNRTCFYINKGLRFIPAKLDVECYDKWAKGGLDRAEKKILIENDLLNQYPINIHPDLYITSPSQSLNQYQKYVKICRFLSASSINLENNKVLVINSTNSYFSLFFKRVNAKITSHVLNTQLKAYNALINKLFHSDKINILVRDLNQIAINENFDTIAYLDQIDGYWESKEMEDLFIRQNSASLYFWVFKSDEALERIEKNFEGYCCEELHHFYSEGNNYKVFAFYNKKISQ